MRWYTVFLLFLPFFVHANEFLYPVAVDAASKNAFLIYQKNPHHIELWQMDIISKQAQQLLLSRCTPAGFTLLPSGGGFSFIDNGILKIKSFMKRSARTVEFDGPIYQTELIHWIDDELCYTSGKYQDHFGIFQVDRDGEVLPILLKKEVDCMYPQKIESDLFYIERDAQWNYRVCQTSYCPERGGDFQERIDRYCSKDQHCFELLSFGKQPVVFLKMVSSTQGFVIGHPQGVSRADKSIPFDYYHLEKRDDIWSINKIFSFEIMGDLLLIGSPMRLYESILPLLPRHYNDQIIFTDIDGTGSSLFRYDLNSKKRSKYSHTELLFPPVGSLCGGLIDEKLIAIHPGINGGVEVQMVNFSL